MQKLWTKDFTIITIGTFVSKLGSVMAGITMSLLVLDKSGSTFLFALNLVFNNIPRIVMPMLAGPLLDRFSRKKMIVALDYISGLLFYGLFLLIIHDQIRLLFIMICNILFGMIDSVYNVAYDSMYPTLCSRENYTRAYSVDSMLYPMAALTSPLGVFLYARFGMAPILLFNTATFFFCAFAESFITEKETIRKDRLYRSHNYTKDLKEGFRFIAQDKGLTIILLYFSLNLFCDATQGTLILPYFKRNPALGEMRFTYMTLCAVAGRLLGGTLIYRYRYPAKWKFLIACAVYTASCFMDGTLLFMPFIIMLVFQFLSGVMGVTSYNIRTTGMQNRVPDHYRARVNGVFSMMFALGSIAGQLMSGLISEWMPPRIVIVLFACLNLYLVFFVFLKNKSAIKPIYNIR